MPDSVGFGCGFGIRHIPSKYQHQHSMQIGQNGLSRNVCAQQFVINVHFHISVQYCQWLKGKVELGNCTFRFGLPVVGCEPLSLSSLFFISIQISLMISV